jgi:hypothetical protein
MEGIKLMGILDDVTHAGDEPEITAEEVLDTRFIDVTDEQLASIKQWLDFASEGEKQIVVDGNITRTVYSHNRLPVKPIFQDLRSKIQTHFEKQNPVYIENYYTVSVTSSESLDVVNDVCVPSGKDSSVPHYHLALVLDGTLNTDTFPGKPFAAKSGYFIQTEQRPEVITHGGTENLRVLCFSLIDSE